MYAIAMFGPAVYTRENSINTCRILVSHYRNSDPIRLKVVQLDVIMTYEAPTAFCLCLTFNVIITC
jgi:hypothetical protein